MIAPIAAWSSDSGSDTEEVLQTVAFSFPFLSASGSVAEVEY